MTGNKHFNCSLARFTENQDLMTSPGSEVRQVLIRRMYGADLGLGFDLVFWSRCEILVRSFGNVAILNNFSISGATYGLYECSNFRKII